MEDKLAITEDELTELSILRSKIEAVLGCIIPDVNAREQTLTYIATDYLGEMGKRIQAMHMAHGMTFDS